MNIIITDTNTQATLTHLVDGINWAQELIGQAGALTDGQFTRLPNSDTYECTRETYDFWLAELDADGEEQK